MSLKPRRHNPIRRSLRRNRDSLIRRKATTTPAMGRGTAANMAAATVKAADTDRSSGGCSTKNVQSMIGAGFRSAVPFAITMRAEIMGAGHSHAAAAPSGTAAG